MNIRINFILILTVIGTLFWQCSETKEVSLMELGTTYFPLETGMYRIYQVDGTIYNFSEDSTVFSYLLKESVLDSFQNLESGISYKILRQKKYSENDPWVIDSIWTARKDDRTAIMVENNISMVKLTFPFRENMTWDGNKLNSRSEDEFEMIKVEEAYSDSYGSYEHTVTVIQEDFIDAIVKTISKKEIYSENKGLVYKENIILIYKQDEFIGLEIVNTGLKYYQHLIEYGEE